MRPAAFGHALILCALAGCTTRRAPVAPPAEPAPAAPAPAPVSLPDRIELPSRYRLLYLNGSLTLVQEAGPRGARPGDRVDFEPPSGGEGLSPAFALQWQQTRESVERMERALSDVMERSRQLSDQAAALEALAKRLATPPAAPAPPAAAKPAAPTLP